jgi:hypothetical protein
MSQDGATPCFSDEEARALARVLDEIIPASGDGRLPGAGELGLAGYIEQRLQEMPELGPVITRGLSAVDELASKRDPGGFGALASRDRVDVLNEVSSTEQTFLPSLILMTYTGYYLDGRVVEALGLEARPPHPKGYDLEPGDLSLLDAVRRRPKLYREC